MTTHTTPVPPLLYTRAQAAALLGVSEYWLRDKVSDDDIPHVRLGKVKGVRFRIEDLESIIEARLRPAVSEPAVKESPEQPAPPAQLRSLRAPGATKPGAKKPHPKKQGPRAA